MSEHDKLIAEATAWLNESPDDSKTERVSERVVSLIGRLTDVVRRLADALESVPAPCNLPSCTNPACASAPAPDTESEEK